MAKAKIIIDKDYVVGQIDKRIYGSFVEHLGGVVYGGIYDPKHPDADELGFRKDVIAQTKELNIPLVRYPGGNFVSGYRWEDGIGPKELRPRRRDLAWNQVDTNQVGVDEFCDWAKLAGTDVMMAVNLGTRGMQEALDLLEYCNYPGGTYLSDLRAKNGHKEPHHIKLWNLGNEMDGPWQIGHKTAEEYGRLALETARVMKKADPSIELVACGSSGSGMSTCCSWEDTVLSQAYDSVDYVSLHCYYKNRDGDTADFLANTLTMDQYIRNIVSTCDYVGAKKRSKKKINLAIDEWNVDNRPFTFEDSLLVGGLLICMLRHADRVKVACQALLVNVMGTIMTGKDGRLWKQGIYYPFFHASNYGRGRSLMALTQSPKYDTKNHTDVPALEAAVVESEEGDYLTFFILNRGEEALETTCDLRDYPGYRVEKMITMAAKDLKACNSPDHPDTVAPVESRDYASDGRQLTLSLPPYSWNVVRIRTGVRL